MNHPFSSSTTDDALESRHTRTHRPDPARPLKKRPRSVVDSRLARRCQQVSGAKYTLLLNAVRHLREQDLLPPPTRDHELDRIEAVLAHLDLLDPETRAVLQQARQLHNDAAHSTSPGGSADTSDG